MIQEEFPGCCGAHVLYNFGHNIPLDVEVENDEDWWHKKGGDDIETIDKALAEYLETEVKCAGGVAMAMITLTPSQTEFLRDTLEKRGFHLVGTGNNGAHYDKPIDLFVYFRKV